MRIAFATDDQRSVRDGRFGDARWFYVVDVVKGKSELREFRLNPHSDPSLAEKPPKVLRLLEDCDVFVGKGWRAGSFELFTRNGKRVMLTSLELLDELIDAAEREAWREFRVYSETEKKFVPVG